MVAGENIGVAVGAGRLVLVPRGVVPGAAGEPNDAGAHGLGYGCAGEAGPARVENAHDVAIADTECTASGIASISGEGSGSKSNGTASTTLRSSTTALKAP